MILCGGLKLVIRTWRVYCILLDDSLRLKEIAALDVVVRSSWSACIEIWHPTPTPRSFKRIHVHGVGITEVWDLRITARSDDVWLVTETSISSWTGPST